MCVHKYLTHLHTFFLCHFNAYLVETREDPAGENSRTGTGVPGE